MAETMTMSVPSHTDAAPRWTKSPARPTTLHRPLYPGAERRGGEKSDTHRPVASFQPPCGSGFTLTESLVEQLQTAQR